MKKSLMLILMSLLLFGLYGCGSPSSEGENKEITQAIKGLSKAKSIEYSKNTEDLYTFGGKQILSKNLSEQKIIVEPFARLIKTDIQSTRIDTKTYRTVIESYSIVSNSQIDNYMRSSNGKEVDPNKEIPPVLGDWAKNSITDKAQVDLMLGMINSNFDAQLYLLSANSDSFRLVKDATTTDETMLKYDGYIDPETVLKAYQLYLRDIWVQEKRLPDLKNPSLEVLKNEIISGGIIELQIGITKLAYSNKPVPISLWINKDTLALVKVVIDESSALQTLLEIEIPKVNPNLGPPIVSSSLCTYDITGIDTLKEIPLPE